MAVTQAKTSKGTSYLSYDEILPTSKDGIRAFVPAGASGAVTAVWLIHGFGGSHDSLIGGFMHTAQALVDAGYVVVGPNLGGSLWSSPKAQAILKESYAALVKTLASRNVTVKNNVMEGTSHGGCIAIYATGKNLIPNIKAVYVINGVYDPMTNKGGYGGGMALDYKIKGGTAATSPENLPISAFSVPIRIVYDETDPTVNAGANGKLFASRLLNAKKNVTVRIHNSEHSTPPGTSADLVKFVRASAD